MKKLLLPILFFALLIACNNEKETPAEEPKTDSSVVDQGPPPPPDIDTTAPVLPPVTETLQKVTYISATYYTGRVDFYFKDENGKRIEVGISNFPEDKGAKYPPSLLESGEELEGPPGENPAMVGKQFYLVKNEAGKLIEIRPVK